MSTPPKVDRLVMYKHGVAFVGRSGPVDGDFTMTFRRDDMKDVLKSLSVQVAGTQAAVGTVAFDTPSDPTAELAERNLLLEPGAALLDLVEGLRGRTVEVHCERRSHRGQVVGVDDHGHQPARRLLVLRVDTGEVNLVDLADARRIDLLEDPSRDDLEYLVDRSRAATAGQHCAVTVQLRGQAERARVSYIVPAPMWRVSYRLVRDGDSLVLAAMGIVHNPLDEDLSDVALTLTTGQPISFDIDLYHGREVQREVIEEPARVAREMAPRRARMIGAMAEPGTMGMAMSLDGDSLDSYAEAADEVEAADHGEYFEYRLSTPVSLKRGGAAMVPLAVAEVAEVRRELVWRNGVSTAPDITLAFTNTTGLVLEEGPAVVYEQDSYAGEAMVGFTSRGAAVRLAFAKDMAVRCRHTASVDTVTTRVRLADEAVVEERRHEKHHLLHSENDHDEAVDVLFELPTRTGHTFGSLDGASDAGTDGPWQRFRVTVPGHQTVQATVVETWPVYTEIDYRHLSPGQLEKWLADRSLDATTMKALSGVLTRWEQADRMDGRCEEIDAERIEWYAAQSRIAEQLKVLGTEGPEGDLRRRQVSELESLQDRISLLDNEINQLREEAAQVRRDATAELHRLIGRQG